MAAKKYLVIDIGRLRVELHYEFSTSHLGSSFSKVGEFDKYTVFSVETDLSWLLNDAITCSECWLEVEYASGGFKSLKVLKHKSDTYIETVCKALKIIDRAIKQQVD